MAEKDNIDPDELLTGGEAFKAMLSSVNLTQQLRGLKKDVMSTKSASKKDAIIKKIKYLDGLRRMGVRPEQAYVLHNIPVLPPIVRPITATGGNKLKHSDVSMLYKDHMAVNMTMDGAKDYMGHDQLMEQRRDLYKGAAAIFGVGEAITGNSRADKLKGIVHQISGTTGPKQGYFHSKLLSKKQDFSGRATLYPEANLGFNEIAMPKDLLWTMYEYHIIRDLVKNGVDYVTAKKEVEARSPSATASLTKLIKTIPTIVNRAPTLMRTNVTAHFPVPVEGKTVGMNPIHLKLYAADADGDALSLHVPMTPEAVEEARKKLLPEAHIHDLRLGHMASMVEPGHEAIVGSAHITTPDTDQEVRHFSTEEEALKAFERGDIKENTPVKIGS